MRAQVCKNTYKEKGVYLKADYLMKGLKANQKVSIQINGYVITGKVYGDKRGIYISSKDVKDYAIPEPKKGGPSCYIDAVRV